jgi:hypothetical protein
MKLALHLVTVPLVAGRTVLVTGATGKTGLAAYKWLQEQEGVEVRALVRNATTAKPKLGCDKCDESEGIFVGDVTKKETLAAAMANVDSLLMAVGSNSHAKDVIFEGTLNQIEMYATAPGNGPTLQDKQIVKVSAALTTLRVNPIDIAFGGGSFFYHSVSDQDISVAGIPYSIIQPCKLNDLNAPPHQTKLIVGHDDKPLPDGHAISGPTAGMISRADVGQLAAWAALHPAETDGTKFDVCADATKKPEGTQEEEIQRVFQEGLLPWDSRKQASVGDVTV